MSALAQKSIFIGTFIFCQSPNELTYLRDSAVCVDEHGVILAVNKVCNQGVSAVDILLNQLGLKEGDVSIWRSEKGQFFFPGFIDTHIHAPQYPNAGIFGKTTLLDWLNTYTFPIEASMKNLNRARAVYTRCVERTLSNGTTTAVYFATMHVNTTNMLADICLAKGQRAFIGRCCMDSDLNPISYRDSSPESCIADTRKTIEYISSIDPKHSLVTPIITPRFAPSCTSQTMHKLGALHQETGLPIQTHISENQSEIHLAQKMFPQCTSYANIYDQHGLLGAKTILAHAVYLTEEEANLIKLRQSKISHCPISNSALTSGNARIRWLLKKGIDVGLGSDLSGGYSASILETAKHAILVSRHVAMNGDEEAKLSVEEVLFLATRGGAKLVGMEEKLGTFDVNMIWDAQLVGLNLFQNYGKPLAENEGKVDIFDWDQEENQIAKWVFNGDDRNTLAVWVQGRLVHRRQGH